MAAARKELDFPSWRRRSKSTSEPQLHLSGPIGGPIDKKLLVLKSAKIAKQLQTNPQEDIRRLLSDLPADEESMEQLAKFCHGYEVNLSTENVVRVALLAHYLEMTEEHCRGNLLNKTILYFEQYILHSWSNSIKVLKSVSKNMFRQAEELGLINCCIETLILKALDDPYLLGEPMRDVGSDEDSDENESEKAYKPNARRKLFDIDWKTDELTSLPLRIYAHIIHGMNERQIPEEYIASNLCQYAKTWLFCNDDVEINKSLKKDIVQALVMLLPIKIGLVACSFLSEMLRLAIALDANDECRNGLEIRIGMQLDVASVKDLLIPCRGYASDEVYDTECLRRVLKHFYNNYTGLDPDSLSVVAELMDQFLAEIAADMDLKVITFIAVAEMSITASEGIKRCSDGIYNAIDVYLEKHRHMTDSEREDLCRVLDCNKLSAEALEHAAINPRLPVRVVVQALFASQLKIRDSIPRGEGRLLKMEEEEEEGEMRTEIEKMGSKVSELERECSVMKREIERGGGGRKRKKFSVWREMKRKFGCMTSNHDCDCHIKRKKVHPRK